jgi:hypothetical protein
LLAHRKYRSGKFPYEFSYESRAEEIEGTANYVEWQVLKQLDEKKAGELTDHMRLMLTKPEYLFPIRISCYYTGALMINALCSAGKYAFSAAERPMIYSVLEDVVPSDGGYPNKETGLTDTAGMIDSFNGETGSIIRSVLEKNEVVLKGPLELTGVNVYNARYYDGFITTTFFLMYREGEENRMLQGNFVVKMQDEKTIAAVYRWK